MNSTKKIILSGIVASGILATSGLIYAASGTDASSVVQDAANAVMGPMRSGSGAEGRGPGGPRMEMGMGGGMGFMMAPTTTDTGAATGTGEFRRPPVDSEIAALDNDATKALREKYQAQAKPILEEIKADHEKLEALAESFSGELATVNPELKAKLDERASKMKEHGGRMGRGGPGGEGRMGMENRDPAEFLSKIADMPSDRATEMLTRMSEGLAKQIEKTTDATEKTKLEGYKSAVDAALAKLKTAS